MAAPMIAFAVLSSNPDPKAFGLENNWHVEVTGQLDSANCLRVSSIKDLGASTHVAANPNVTCVDPGVCAGNPPKPPQAGFAGCTLDTASAKNTSRPAREPK